MRTFTNQELLSIDSAIAGTRGPSRPMRVQLSASRSLAATLVVAAAAAAAAGSTIALRARESVIASSPVSHIHCSTNLLPQPSP